MPEPANDDVARTRWMVLVGTRLAGVAFVIIGLLITQRRIEAPEPLGYVLAIAGILGFFVLPIRLARKWRSPDA